MCYGISMPTRTSTKKTVLLPGDRQTQDRMREAHDRGQHGDKDYWAGICTDCAQEKLVARG